MFNLSANLSFKILDYIKSNDGCTLASIKDNFNLPYSYTRRYVNFFVIKKYCKKVIGVSGEIHVYMR